MDKNDVIFRLEEYTVRKDGCWLFIGVIGNSGYGRLKVDGRYYSVHRLSLWLHKNFDLDSNLQGRHSCTNKNCWNPEHLEAGTHMDNMSDWSALRTHCIHGHELTEDNTYFHRGTGRCKTCQREYKRKHRSRS